jgi:hypothetical protein
MPDAQEADRPPSSLSDTLSEILQRAGVGKLSNIRVTGSAGLASLLWFCRHGYEHVGYSRGGPGGDDIDLLFVPQTCDLKALDAILSQGPHPTEGGVLIVQTPDVGALGGVDPVHDLLVRRGYRVERCLHGRHRELHVARRCARAPLRVAA